MSDAVREQLLGYLLGALDEADQDAVEKDLEEDPRLRGELILLSRALAPLDATRREYDPPPDLAARTCRAVFAMRPRPGGRTWTRAPRPTRGQAEPLRRRSRLRWQDAVAAAALLVAATMLLFPGVVNSREKSRLLACQNNLREIGNGLAKYSQANLGYFPVVPAQGNLAAAGSYAPTLVQGGFLTDSRSFVCPSSPLAADRQFRIPTVADIQAADGREQLGLLQQNMGGSYGYCLGHMEDGVYMGTKNLSRPNFALMSDAPNPLLPGRQSGSHGQEGQNVLFEDQHVQFVNGTNLPGQTDNFFLNDAGQVAPGLHENDAVIAASPVRPVPVLIHVEIRFHKKPTLRASEKTGTPHPQPEAAGH